MGDNGSECRRRGCEKEAVFVVRERYPEETGKGIVKAEAHLCRDHTREEHPTNLDSSTSEYLFQVKSLRGEEFRREEESREGEES